MAKSKSKNKNKKVKQQQLSPEKYIRQKVRSLPVDKCYMSGTWRIGGMVEVMVSRRHAGGNYTLGIYLIDTLCTGLKETSYRFSAIPYDFDNLILSLTIDGGVEVEYKEAHNLIYGAIAYAEELGIEPATDFDLTQYILEEDTDDIPLIEYEYGENGRPFLVVKTELEASKYIPLLEKSTGGDFGYKLLDEDEYFDDFFEDEYPEAIYLYTQPEYPTKLNLTHAELNCLFKSDDDCLLTTEEIDLVLSLPRESLIADLQQIVLYMIGKNDGDAALPQALFFLEELRAEEALDTVLEVMRQDEDFLYDNFGDYPHEILGQTLYYVGRNKLPKLLEFAKEPGLYPFFKAVSFVAVNMVSKEPGRREEVLDWYRELMDFYCLNMMDLLFYSAEIGGLLIAEMLSLIPIELFPELEEFYAICDVDDDFYETFEKYKEGVLDLKEPLKDYSLMDIYERNKEYCEYRKDIKDY